MANEMPWVTFDTTTKPNDPLVEKARNFGYSTAFTSVSHREASGADFAVKLSNHKNVPEIGIWDESSWNSARWASEESADCLEKVLQIVAGGSFPRVRNNLSEGQLHQLRRSVIRSLRPRPYNKSLKYVPPASWFHRTRAAHALLN